MQVQRKKVVANGLTAELKGHRGHCRVSYVRLYTVQPADSGDVGNGLDIKGEDRTQDYFCTHAPLGFWYYQPGGARSIQRCAKVARMSSSHSGLPLARAISR